MTISVRLGTALDSKSVTINKIPDRCPQCHRGGKQTYFPSLPVETRTGAIEPSLWSPLICPFEDCDRPFFAVYEPLRQRMRYDPDYKYRYSTPCKPKKKSRDGAIESISNEFYDIMDQAIAAEDYRLTLIAGMGYRKALEYLVKDYVTKDARAQLKKAQEIGNDAEVLAAKIELQSILARDLKPIIQMIPHELTVKAAERCAWLGNDETHYTCLLYTSDAADD